MPKRRNQYSKSCASKSCASKCSPCETICGGGGETGPAGPPGPPGPQGPTGLCLEGPFPNDIHVCLRPGESKEINLGDYTQAGTFPINPSTYTIEQHPFFDAGLSSIMAGVVTYTADTRFLGSDYFTFSVMDTMGNTSPTFGTVLISVQCLIPQPIIPATFIYSGSSNKTVYTYNRDSGSTELFEDTDGTHIGPLNSLATNRADGLIYYVASIGGTGTLFAYDYLNALFLTIMMPDGVTPVTGVQLGTTDLASGGATYTDGVLFLGLDGPTYVRIPMDRYVPGEGEQSITDYTVITIETSPTIEYGDLAYDPISSSLIIISRTPSFRAYVINPLSGTLYYDVASSATQIARGPDNVFYTTDRLNPTLVQRYNVYSGTISSVVGPSLVDSPADMADYICPGCPLGETTTIP